MDRPAYNNCMKPYMTGKGLSKEERQQNICVGAKICSGKASNKEDAARLCAEAPAKEPKARKTRQSCPKAAEELVSCIMPKLDPGNLQDSLRQAVHLCSCNKPPKKETKAQKMQKAFEDMTPEEQKALQAIAEVSAYYGTD